MLYSSHTTWATQEDFGAWSKSGQFRAAHRQQASERKPLTLGHPEFEGFEVIQTIEDTHPPQEQALDRWQRFRGVRRHYGRGREAAGSVAFRAVPAMSQRVLKIVSQMPGEPKPSLKLTLLRR